MMPIGFGSAGPRYHRLWIIAPLLQTGKPEHRRYTVIYMVKDMKTGQYGDGLVITVRLKTLADRRFNSTLSYEHVECFVCSRQR